MNKVLVITGPTAAGKSALAYEFARRNDAEIVSCDSMQIYKYMDIGTAKPPQDDLDTVKHHLISIIEPNEEYNVVRYKQDAIKSIEKILNKGKLPVITGGTGLYLNSLIYNIDFSDKTPSPDIQREIEALKENKSPVELHQILAEKDPFAAERIHPNNIKRVVRALELTLIDKKHHYKGTFETDNKLLYDFRIAAINMPRERLFEKINDRVEDMLRSGLVRETSLLLDKGLLTSKTAVQAIGYKEVILHLKGGISYDEMAELIKKNTRNYAKRQLTWLKKISGITWIDTTDFDIERSLKTIQKLIVFAHAQRP